MSFDFDSMSRPSGASAPIDPEEIFRRLPNLDGAPNDLWRGQSEALRAWHDNRHSSDVVLSLNTGAGKTVVGLLIAQSLQNEGIGKVLYVCSTNDLIEQTANEATKKLGLKFTTRMAGQFSNQLYEREEAFCITNYQTLFQPFSVFTGEREPAAIIFDDAHVAEKAVRDSFTMTVKRETHKNLFDEIRALFEPQFDEVDAHALFLNVIDGGSPGKTILAPPIASFRVKNEFEQLARTFKLHEDRELKFPYGHLLGKFDRCAVVFSAHQIEICPPFLPSSKLPVLGRDEIRRVYLSATLKSRSDFGRAFGRKADNPIEPDSDAGNGERLIAFGSSFSNEFDLRSFVKNVSRKQPVVVSVPSYQAANKWKDIAEIPEKDEFTKSLNKFRQQGSGALVLVSRVDGIDLPGNVCRIMVMDGMPTGETLLERYQYAELGMNTFLVSKYANRIAQLFGRINRGRNDYGVFFVTDLSLEAWLRHRRYKYSLPTLLTKQLLLAEVLSEQIGLLDNQKAKGLVDQVLGRDEGWMSFYRDSIDGVDILEEQRSKAVEVEIALEKASLKEGRFMSALWNSDYESAARVADEMIDLVASEDSRLAGWYGLWAGMAYQRLNNDAQADLRYRQAEGRLSKRLPVPRFSVATVDSQDAKPKSSLHRELVRVFRLPIRDRNDDIAVAKAAIRNGFLEDASTNVTEEAVRILGERLGFVSTRPDNQIGKGPDVLWFAEEEQKAILIECKTGKKPGGQYKKRDDIGQAHDNIGWFRGEYPEEKLLGLVFVGPELSVSGSANPSQEMYLCKVGEMEILFQRFFAALADLETSVGKATPLEMYGHLDEFIQRTEWSVDSIFSAIAIKPMSDLKNS